MTWQGGAIPGSECPLALLTQQRTWGQLKNLYRQEDATTKRPLLSIALCVLLARQGTADGLNLAWNNCYPGPGSTGDISPACDAGTLGEVFHLFGSLISGPTITNVTAHQSRVEFQNGNPTLDDWWRMAPGDCRAGQFAPTFTPETMTGSDCDKTVLGTGNTSSASSWADNLGESGQYRPTGHARLPYGCGSHGSSRGSISDL